MKQLLRNLTAAIAAVVLIGGLALSSAQAAKIRIALAETPSDELAAFFVALDRAKKNGLDYEWTAFSDEELAIQAVLSSAANRPSGPAEFWVTERDNSSRTLC